MLGGWWYSPSGFLDAWVMGRYGKSRKVLEEEAKSTGAQGHSASNFIWAFLFALGSSVAYRHWVAPAGAEPLLLAAGRGALLGGAFVLPCFGINAQLGCVPGPWTVSGIDAGFHIVQLAMYGAVHALLHKE